MFRVGQSMSLHIFAESQAGGRSKSSHGVLRIEPREFGERGDGRPRRVMLGDGAAEARDRVWIMVGPRHRVRRSHPSKQDVKRPESGVLIKCRVGLQFGANNVEINRTRGPREYGTGRKLRPHGGTQSPVRDHGGRNREHGEVRIRRCLNQRVGARRPKGEESARFQPDAMATALIRHPPGMQIVELQMGVHMGGRHLFGPTPVGERSQSAERNGRKSHYFGERREILGIESEIVIDYSDGVETVIDASPHHLTREQVEFFDANGYLILRQWITGELLMRLQSAGHRWIEDGLRLGRSHPDYAFAQRSDKEVFFRVDYLHDKGEPSALELLGAPQVLAVAESLCGRDFVPTYESMVFKNEGDGEAIRWHQDACHPRRHRVFNFDLYLDESRAGAGALHVVPGSQTGPIDACHFEAEHGWRAPNSIEVEMEPGDVLLHDVMVVHGSPRTVGNRLRRTIYYEFRPAAQIREEGPWGDDWIEGRMAMIPHALRAYRDQFPQEPQFDWRPSRPVAAGESLRIEHLKHTPGSYCSASSPAILATS